MRAAGSRTAECGTESRRGGNGIDGGDGGGRGVGRSTDAADGGGWRRSNAGRGDGGVRGPVPARRRGVRGAGRGRARRGRGRGPGRSRGSSRPARTRTRVVSGPTSAPGGKVRVAPEARRGEVLPRAPRPVRHPDAPRAREAPASAPALGPPGGRRGPEGRVRGRALQEAPGARGGIRRVARPQTATQPRVRPVEASSTSTPRTRARSAAFRAARESERRNGSEGKKPPPE